MLRPRACDFRRLRFSRNACFKRSCRASSQAPGLSASPALSSFIADPFEYEVRHTEYTGGRTNALAGGRRTAAPPHDATLEFSIDIGN